MNVATEFDKFKDVLFNEKIVRHKIKRIQSKKHTLGAYEIDKISLSCFGNKRYVLDDGIYTLSTKIIQGTKKYQRHKKHQKALKA